MSAPHWLVGLGRLVWHVALGPLALTHMGLSVVGGGQLPRWVEECPPRIIPSILSTVAWAMLLAARVAP